MRLILVAVAVGDEQTFLPSPLSPDGAHCDGCEYPGGHRNFNLSVPFYLYSGGGFDASTHAYQYTQYSKGLEESWLNRLQRHPWRVKDPDEALVFRGAWHVPYCAVRVCA